MKKIFFSLSVLAIALTTSSCINDLDEGQKPGANGGGRAITFETWANKETRASATKADDVTDFAVLATEPTAAPGAQVLIDGLVVTGSNAAGWTYSPSAYWPETATVNFYAFSPTAAVGVTGGATALVGQNDANTDEPTIEYELPALLSDQRDLLVANHSGAYAQEGAGGVLLNFRHALSRVKFQVKSESATDFEVLSIRLKNVKSKAKLDLSGLPKDAAAFPYPTDNATVASPGYQTFWVPDNLTTPTVVDLEATLTNSTVAGGGAWTDVVGDDDAIYVIPQTNLASSLDSATIVKPGDPDPAPGEFYIEIRYKDVAQTDADAKTYAVPVPAIVGDAYASSIAFEMERQYTFRFELFGRKLLRFQGVRVSDYDEVTREEPLRLQWAGSNIYWDNAKQTLTFADSDDKSKEEYQGVFFKWGSLVGMSAAGANNSGWTRITYFPTNPGVDDTWTTDATTYATHANIPYVDAPAGPYPRDHAYLTTITNDATNGATTIAARKGDICVYLTKTGAAPKGKRWRMPTSEEFKTVADYTIINPPGSFTAVTSQNADGTGTITGGYRLTDLNQPYFPASGFRGTTGSLYGPSAYGYYWSSSPSSTDRGYCLYIYYATVEPASSGPRGDGFMVRCVAK